MKKATKRISILAIFIGMLMISMVPAFAETSTESDTVARTVQFGGQNLYLDKGDNNDALAIAKDDSSAQNFYFDYDLSKKAYKIYSAENSNLIVSWNSSSTDSVSFTNNGDSDENYWVLEEVPSSDVCYLRNFAKGNDGYLTAKTVQGTTKAVVSEKAAYSKITISPSLRNDQTIENSQYRVISVAEPTKFLNRDVTMNVSTYIGTDSGLRINWAFEYFPEKDAYKITNTDDEGLFSVLTWNSNEDDNVYASNDLSNDDQFWRLESVGNGNYVIKNYKNPNKVLDVSYLTAKSSQVVVSDRTNAATQQFKLEKI